MRIIFRLLISGWILSVILASVSIAYGRLFPAPIVEWATMTHYIHDTQVGLDYPVNFLPGVEDNFIFTRGQSIESPDGQYQMSVDRRNNGLNLRFFDRQGQAINALLSERDNEIYTVFWLNHGNVLLIRNLSTSDNLNLVRFNVLTGEEQIISPYYSGLFDLSPGRNWLILSDSLTGETILQNVEDERRYTIEPVLFNNTWTNDERYLASSAILDNQRFFLLMDTTSGTVITRDIVPEAINTSPDNETILIQTTTGIAVYRGTNFILEQDISSPVVQTLWVSDGAYGIIVTDNGTDYSLYLVDSKHESPVRHLSTIPGRVSLLSIQAAIHDDVLTYILNSPQYTESLVYRINIPDGETALLTRIPLFDI